jgi:ElaB/YqjD/DUF883 family membrane-anchored ribosome-binding protein
VATDDKTGNGHGTGNGNGAALERRVEAQREVVRRTAAELEDRLRDKTHEVREKIENAREKVQDKVQEVREKMHVVGDRMQDVTEFVQRHRYAVLGGALAAGAVLGMRGGRRASRAKRRAEPEIRYVMAQNEKKAGLLGSIMGAAAAFAVKQGVQMLTERLQGDGGGFPDERTDRYQQLPPPMRRPFVE